jgi:hypothetical protein
VPTFTVLRTVDAYVRYTAEVEADDADQAAQMAENHEADYTWEQTGIDEFDARSFVTLDDDGQEIEGTGTGDF